MKHRDNFILTLYLQNHTTTERKMKAEFVIFKTSTWWRSRVGVSVALLTTLAALPRHYIDCTSGYNDVCDRRQNSSNYHTCTSWKQGRFTLFTLYPTRTVNCFTYSIEGENAEQCKFETEKRKWESNSSRNPPITRRTQSKKHVGLLLVQ
jgi:hypothetical protein